MSRLEDCEDQLASAWQAATQERERANNLLKEVGELELVVTTQLLFINQLLTVADRLRYILALASVVYSHIYDPSADPDNELDKLEELISEARKYLHDTGAEDAKES